MAKIKQKKNGSPVKEGQPSAGKAPVRNEDAPETAAGAKGPARKTKGAGQKHEDPEVLFQMSHSGGLYQEVHWIQMLPVLVFTAFIPLIVRMHFYERPMMSSLFWSGGATELSDFFSYYKMTTIFACAILAVVFLLYRIFCQNLIIRKSVYYWPMLVYTLCVLLSFAFSAYKDVALWGWNDRFEGTVPVISYMVMLFFIINTVKTEKHVRWILNCVAASSVILGLLGLSQALDKDFFRTALGKRLITPGWFWEHLDTLNFVFQNKQIYQTVYNINYVSFYLTLLVPLFGLVFIYTMNKGKEASLRKKILWAGLFALAVFNLIGSASSGGIMGMAAVVLLSLILLNKRILSWWKPVALLLAVSVLIIGATWQRWAPELSDAYKGVSGKTAGQIAADLKKNAEAAPGTIGKIDYMETKGFDIHISVNGNPFKMTLFPQDPESIRIVDQDDERIPLVLTEVSPIYRLDDPRFSMCLIQPAMDDTGNPYLIFSADRQKQNWVFRITEEQVFYNTELGNLTTLEKVPSIGWKNNGAWGAGRGYIFSRTLPMMKKTLILGHGADTYCLYFPHQDYVGKYNSGTFTSNINIVVDKPHNLYFGMIIGTGGISLLAFLALLIIYLVQSFRLYFRSRFDSFLPYAGAGISLGAAGFMVSAFVNDSNVSVMPMFYGLLGTGIAINYLLKKEAASVK